MTHRSQKESKDYGPIIVETRVLIAVYRFKYDRVSMDHAATKTREMKLSKHHAYFRKYRAALRNAAGMELNGISPRFRTRLLAPPRNLRVMELSRCFCPS